MGEVDRGVAAFGDQCVNIISADAAHQVREAGGNFILFPHAQRQQVAGQLGIGHAGGQFAEMHFRSVSEDCVDCIHIVAHRAVDDGTGAAAVIAGHAADGCLGRGRHIDGKHEPMRRKEAVQLIQHHAGLHGDPPRLGVEVHNLVQMAAYIDDNGFANGLPALRRSAAARQHGEPCIRRDLNYTVDIRFVFRYDDAYRFDLVMRGIGAVATPAEGIEQDRALDFALKLVGKRAVADVGPVCR